MRGATRRSDRPRAWGAAAAAVVLLLLVTLGVLHVVHTATTVSAPTQPTLPPTPPTAGAATALPPLSFGFYSAGLVESDCFGSCRPGQPGYLQEQQDRARLAQLESLHVDFVANNVSIAFWYHRYPQATVAFLDAVKAAGVNVSYALAAEPDVWFAHGRFDPSHAQRLFAATDLNHDGISDLDGHLGAVYGGHEVLEWATHAQRVAMYRYTKKWFPHTPIEVYYAGFDRPFDPAWAHTAHPYGPGGHWSDYAYGPGEADIVHIGIRGDGRGVGVDTAGGSGTRVDAAAVHSAVAHDVALVHRLTHTVPVFISTNFAGDSQMQTQPGAMWSPTEIRSWYQAVSSVPGVRGVLLRSYGRFRYDLGYSGFTTQRAQWAALGEQADRVHGGAGT